MSDVKNKRVHIVSDFTDAGTGESFKAGDTPLIEAGARGNYEAAGLVKIPVAEKAKPAARQKRAAKQKIASTPVAAPVVETAAIPADGAQPAA